MAGKSRLSIRSPEMLLTAVGADVTSSVLKQGHDGNYVERFGRWRAEVCSHLTRAPPPPRISSGHKAARRKAVHNSRFMSLMRMDVLLNQNSGEEKDGQMM